MFRNSKKYPRIFRASRRKIHPTPQEVLEEVETRLRDEFVPHIINMQNDNGSYPWGYENILHKENVDRTASVVLSLKDYVDGRIRPVVEKAGAYLESQILNGQARLNPWLGGAEDVGILGLSIEAFAKLYGSDSRLISTERGFIDRRINPSGEPEVPGKYRMQNTLGAAFKVLRAYAATGRKDFEEAKVVKNFILRQQKKDGHLDVGVSWKDIAHKLYSMTGATKVEMTSVFIDTFVSELGYSPFSKEMIKAADYVSRCRYLSSITTKKVPTTIIGHVNSILLTHPSYNLEDIRNNFPNLYGNFVKALRMPVGSNIEQDLGRVGSLIKFSNMIKSRYKSN